MVDFNKTRLIDLYDVNSIDYIYCSHFLEHLINPYQFIIDSYSILKKNCEINVILPNSRNSTIAHKTFNIGRDFFYCLKKSGNLQGGSLFNISVKMRRKHKFIEFYYRLYRSLIDSFLRLFYDEIEFKMIKK